MKDKKAKDKPLYSMPSNAVFMLKKAWKIDKIFVIASVMRIPVYVLMPLLTTYLSKYVVELVSEGSSAGKLVTYVLCISAAILLIHLTYNYINIEAEWRANGNRFFFQNLCAYKIMDMDYDNIEDPDNQTKMQKAFNTINNNHVATQRIFDKLVNIFSNFSGLVTYSALTLH